MVAYLVFIRQRFLTHMTMCAGLKLTFVIQRHTHGFEEVVVRRVTRGRYNQRLEIHGHRVRCSLTQSVIFEIHPPLVSCRGF